PRLGLRAGRPLPRHEGLRRADPGRDGGDGDDGHARVARQGGAVHLRRRDGAVRHPSVMMALRQRDRTGEGQEVDVSMFDCMTSMLGYFPFRHFYEGYVPQRVGMGHHLLAPYDAYPVKGGKLIAVACASEATWHHFAEALGHPEWKDEPRFRDNAARYAHR